MVNSKVCFKCKRSKPLSEFYVHPAMGDGHLGKCKECTKSDARKHRAENLERIRGYDRQRAKNKDRLAANVACTKAWREDDKRRQQCHNAVRRAVLAGALKRKPCERCGDPKSLAHHEDYDKPLDVTWLCQPCHKKRHKEMG